jgi:hypothetical protein
MNLLKRIALLTVPLVAAACASEGGETGTCSEGSCDEVAPLTCEVVDHSGLPTDLSSLHDPIAERVLRARECVTDRAAVLEQLAECDARVRFEVSERNAVGAENPIVREVGSGGCDGLAFFFSVFGVRPGAPLPDDLELMAQRSDGAGWNFYALEQGAWKFFGSSVDMLEGRGAGEVRKCAACHPAGTLVMKELKDPWVNWNPGFRAAEAFEFGVRGDHADLVGARLERALRGTVADLVRPALCTDDFNLTTTMPFGGSLDTMVAPAILSPAAADVARLSSVTLPGTEINDGYVAAIERANQRLEIRPDVPLRHAETGAVIRDTAFSFIVPEVAGADEVYLSTLAQMLAVNSHGGPLDKLLRAASMADFTRPVFSDPRCALLDHAPTAPAADATAESIVAGFVQSLEAKRSGVGLDAIETQFLTDLTDPGAFEAQAGRVSAFAAACKALSTDDFLDQLLRAASSLRLAARDHPLIEFREQLPVDDLGVGTGARIDPETCRVE